MWSDAAKCRDMGTELFFPEDDDFETIDETKKFCEDCPIKDLCLEYALTHKATILQGIYGGTTGPERQQILLDRKKSKG